MAPGSGLRSADRNQGCVAFDNLERPVQNIIVNCFTHGSILLKRGFRILLLFNIVNIKDDLRRPTLGTAHFLTIGPHNPLVVATVRVNHPGRSAF
jgi:hypothetical protein